MIFSVWNGWAQSTTRLEDTHPKRVLMLFSEGRDTPGNLMLEESIREEMQKASTNPIEFYSEHLDSSRFSDTNHLHLFQDYIGKKYAGEPLDLVGGAVAGLHPAGGINGPRCFRVCRWCL